MSEAQTTTRANHAAAGESDFAAYIGAREPVARSWPARFIDFWFSDRRFNVSRPKVIFLVAFIDLVCATLAGLLAELVTGDGDFALATMRSVAAAFLSVSLLKHNWAYTIQALRHPSRQIEKIGKSLLSAVCILIGACYMLQWQLPRPSAIVLFTTLSGLLMILGRLGVRRIIARLTESGRLVRRTVVVGGGPEAEALIHALEREQIKQIQILGVFDDRDDERSSDSFAGYAKLGNFAQLSAFCRNNGVDLLVVTVSTTAEQRLLQILKTLHTIPVDVRISAMNSKLRLSARAYSHIGSIPMLAVMDRPMTDWDRAIKNFEDRVLGSLLTLATLPIMALVALAIRLDSPGPILFRQRRYGFNNELIEVFKFRSMHVASSDATASKLVTKDDPRVTRVGRFIRKSSLDELPQLFNVLLGEMSLVGPRPHATQAKAQSDLYQSVVDGYFARHRVKPGVTGWAQINGWRGETDTHEKIQKRVDFDMHYIDNWSVMTDLKILLLTPFALLTGKNAY